MNNNILKDNHNAILQLCNTHDVSKLWAFGSVCTDDFKEQSDIDLLILFTADISVEKYTDNYFELHDNFEQIFNRSVDLLTEKMVSNPYFIKVMEQTKTLIYERQD